MRCNAEMSNFKCMASSKQGVVQYGRIGLPVLYDSLLRSTMDMPRTEEYYFTVPY